MNHAHKPAATFRWQKFATIAVVFVLFLLAKWLFPGLFQNEQQQSQVDSQQRSQQQSEQQSERNQHAPTDKSEGASNRPGNQTTAADRKRVACQLERVVDGDTLVVNHPEYDRIKVRLLGIDTPETVKRDTPVEAFGPEAKEFTEAFVSGGTVSLQFDQRLKDQFDRYLAYVYVGDRMLNEELVARGLARVKFYGGDAASMGERLKAVELKARHEQVGIWSK